MKDNSKLDNNKKTLLHLQQIDIYEFNDSFKETVHNSFLSDYCWRVGSGITSDFKTW